MTNDSRINALYGILLVAAFAIVAFFVAKIEVVQRLSLSPLIVGLLLGMVYANTFRKRLPESWAPGLKLVCNASTLKTERLDFAVHIDIFGF